MKITYLVIVVAAISILGGCTGGGGGSSSAPQVLTWINPTLNVNYTWAQADTLCQTTTYNGKTGWRLPTQPELTAYAQSFTVAPQLGGIWSSTVAPTATNHYVVSLNSRTGSAYIMADYSYLYVLCVQ
jgi:hypothetical protein